MGMFPKDRDLTKTPERVELLVDASYFRERIAGFHIRLDQFLATHLTWRSRSSIQALVRDGYVLVDPASPEAPQGHGREELELRPGRKLAHGSRVVVVIPDELRLPAVSVDPGALAILYEDEEVVAVDKPPMLAVHPSGRHLTDTLIQRVHAHYLPDVESGRLVPRLCHRLDRETSGIVLVSKNPRTHHKVMRQFERRRVEKDYLAIVHGELGDDSGTIDFPLATARTSSIALKMTVAADGLPSRTDWFVVDRGAGYTLLRCRLHTGRQHQIRVHLAAIAHPVVGDKLYGPDETLFQKAIHDELSASDLRRLELPRHALHNHRLLFRTPAGGAEVEVVSELARDLREWWEMLRDAGSTRAVPPRGERA
jgi:23S rRNA pseudouridine1911/1915/1917 synthase